MSLMGRPARIRRIPTRYHIEEPPAEVDEDDQSEQQQLGVTPDQQHVLPHEQQLQQSFELQPEQQLTPQPDQQLEQQPDQQPEQSLYQQLEESIHQHEHSPVQPPPVIDSIRSTAAPFADLPPFANAMRVPTQTINGVSGVEFVSLVDSIYDGIFRWKKNLFKIPSGNASKRFVKLLAEWLKGRGGV